ncbi:MAG: peptide-methionine (R)-S-oxide reductase MsrB [Vampirovibrionales bacterium]|nr:peptide-methionine (R)-S-oxide reductase MsrB [Vampirovibrionales bacterium]
MKNKKLYMFLVAVTTLVSLTFLFGCSPVSSAPASAPKQKAVREYFAGEQFMIEKDHTQKSDAEWREQLTPEQYEVLRNHGTERPFSGQYDHFYKPGRYVCAACGHTLFYSDTKFDSKSGWPSFYSPADKAAVGESKDSSLGMVRTEFHCAKCGGHLGHVFPDGPAPSGLRYCTNSVSLKFVPESDQQ